MKPVLIQHLIKRNKGKTISTPTSKDKAEHYNNKFASFIVWFIGALVLVGLLLG